ncbi:hypothetical protein FIBSPDRAFT_884477 [Athelia psychrophila]|uniref:Uncharacterized protein n=1 Tax=Athelia psychrophila TaxID=1759441 RepID=A0A166T682_9AGAM|nr:hypothetical protein FIBSPDRAFT_884477 [Fibularhizoctonia sp. CBS 109695]
MDSEEAVAVDPGREAQAYTTDKLVKSTGLGVCIGTARSRGQSQMVLAMWWQINFKALAQGIHYRTGMKKPGNVSNTKHNAQILDSLIKLKEFPCVASFTNSCFHT